MTVEEGNDQIGLIQKARQKEDEPANDDDEEEHTVGRSKSILMTTLRILIVFYALSLSLRQNLVQASRNDPNYVVLGRLGNDRVATKVPSLTFDRKTFPEVPIRISCSSEVVKPKRYLRKDLTGTIIPKDAWEEQTGREFMEHPEWVDDLVQTGLRATNEASSSDISWKLVSDASNLDEGVRVWVGKATREGYGSQLPFIRTQSHLPMKPQEVADLLMDSSRVKVYNPWSLGRRDVWKADEFTKIVKSKTQPPVGSKKIVSTTLMHGRQIDSDRWIVVTRGVGGQVFKEDGDDECGRSDFLLGVNYLIPLQDGESCQLINVAQVYSPSLPQMLAERLGVKSAIQYVKDIRKSAKKSAA